MAALKRYTTKRVSNRVINRGAHGSRRREHTPTPGFTAYYDHLVDNPLFGNLTTPASFLLNGDKDSPYAHRLVYQDLLGIDCGGQRAVTDIRLYLYTTCPVPVTDLINDVFWLYHSSDNSTWEDFYSLSNPPITNIKTGFFSIDLEFDETDRFFKIYKQAGYLVANTNYFCWVTELEIV